MPHRDGAIDEEIPVLDGNDRLRRERLSAVGRGAEVNQDENRSPVPAANDLSQQRVDQLGD